MISQSPAPVTCPRGCGHQLEAITPGGKNPERASITSLVCTNPAGCIGPLSADFAPGGALAPQATPAPAPAAHVRRSNEVAGLVLEFDGAGHLTFRYAAWFTTYAIAGGMAEQVDCSDRGQAPPAAYRVMGRVARAYAAKLAERAVA